MRAAILGEEKPCFLATLAGIQKLKLGIGNTAKVRVGIGRLLPECTADNLDQPLAVVDLVAENLREVARLGSEDILPDGVMTSPCSTLAVS